ncbi:MAG: DNA polymerase III subunit gamma/tau [SAR324 cluster bacterium]|nr:DNA polymerase III subunit gamma/tau [SAR324 cluster bacterium]
MSYLVLARKLRPQRFQDLVGQDSIWKTLLNAFAQDRVAHAFLFTGPRGTGKTSCARILTKALNCKNPQNYEPCNVCEHCVEISQGIAADVMEIDAASNRGIEHIRELRASVKFSPAKFPYKTYIIDEVHMLTTESFNALLKTLEEPPSHVKFILATTDHHKVPTTVISRCQRYDFHNIEVGEMSAYLAEVAHKEGINISASSLAMISRSSVGGMRDALTTLDMLIGFCGSDIDDGKVIEILGLNEQREVDALLTGIMYKDLEMVMENLHYLIKKGRSFGQLLNDMMTAVKDVTLIKELGLSKVYWKDFLPDQAELYQNLADMAGKAELHGYFQILLELETQVKRSSQAQACMEMGMIRMARAESIKGVAEVIQLLEQVAGPDHALKKKSLLN